MEKIKISIECGMGKTSLSRIKKYVRLFIVPMMLLVSSQHSVSEELSDLASTNELPSEGWAVGFNGYERVNNYDLSILNEQQDIYWEGTGPTIQLFRVPFHKLNTGSTNISTRFANIYSAYGQGIFRANRNNFDIGRDELEFPTSSKACVYASEYGRGGVNPDASFSVTAPNNQTITYPLQFELEVNLQLGK